MDCAGSAAALGGARGSDADGAMARLYFASGEGRPAATASPAKPRPIVAVLNVDSEGANAANVHHRSSEGHDIELQGMGDSNYLQSSKQKTRVRSL